MSGEDVVADVAAQHGVKPSQVRGQKRCFSLTKARIQVAKRMDAMGFSCLQIGAALGGRHHTTVLYLLGRLGSRKAMSFSPVLAALNGGLGTDE